MPDWKQRLQVLKPSPLFLFGLTMMSLPIGYILKKHLDWKPKPDSKKRMLIHHGVFWLSCIPALKFFHNTWRYFERHPDKIALKPGGFWPAAGWMGAALGTLIGSFEGGDKVARYLVPKQPPPAESPQTFNTTPFFSSVPNPAVFNSPPANFMRPTPPRSYSCSPYPGSIYSKSY